MSTCTSPDFLPAFAGFFTGGYISNQTTEPYPTVVSAAKDKVAHVFTGHGTSTSGNSLCVSKLISFFNPRQQESGHVCGGFLRVWLNLAVGHVYGSEVLIKKLKNHEWLKINFVILTLLFFTPLASTSLLLQSTQFPVSLNGTLENFTTTTYLIQNPNDTVNINDLNYMIGPIWNIFTFQESLPFTVYTYEYISYCQPEMMACGPNCPQEYGQYCYAGGGDLTGYSDMKDMTDAGKSMWEWEWCYTVIPTSPTTYNSYSLANLATIALTNFTNVLNQDEGWGTVSIIPSGHNYTDFATILTYQTTGRSIETVVFSQFTQSLILSTDLNLYLLPPQSGLIGTTCSNGGVSIQTAQPNVTVQLGFTYYIVQNPGTLTLTSLTGSSILTAFGIASYYDGAPLLDPCNQQFFTVDSSDSWSSSSQSPSGFYCFAVMSASSTNLVLYQFNNGTAPQGSGFFNGVLSFDYTTNANVMLTTNVTQNLEENPIQVAATMSNVNNNPIIQIETSQAALCLITPSPNCSFTIQLQSDLTQTQSVANCTPLSTTILYNCNGTIGHIPVSYQQSILANSIQYTFDAINSIGQDISARSSNWWTDILSDMSASWDWIVTDWGYAAIAEKILLVITIGILANSISSIAKCLSICMPCCFPKKKIIIDSRNNELLPLVRTDH